MRDMWNAVHCNFERNGDLLLDLFCSDSGPLRDDFNVVVGNIRISLDRQRVESYHSRAQKKQSQRYDKKSLIECKVYNPANHCPYFSTVSWRTSAFPTTTSPGF